MTEPLLGPDADKARAREAMAARKARKLTAVGCLGLVHLTLLGLLVQTWDTDQWSDLSGPGRESGPGEVSWLDHHLHIAVAVGQSMMFV